jgi:putative transposase
MERHKPATGVFLFSGQPTIVFVTVCSEKREPWIANEEVHQLLVETWQGCTAWLVGYYLLMPDHAHFFCAPRDTEIPLKRWMSYWKRQFTFKAKSPKWKWQSLHWDPRLRRAES